MERINVEFDCQMKTPDDLRMVEKTLKQIDHLDNINLDLEQKSVRFSLSAATGRGFEEIQKKIEKETGLLTVIKGFGDTISAVSEIHGDYLNVKNLKRSVEESQPVIGVIRLTQLFNNQCFVDAVIDNLSDKSQSPFSVSINEYGDLSGQNLEKVGQPKIRLIDSLPAQATSTRFNRLVDSCDLSDCIGRSVVVNSRDRKPLAAGIVARASPVSGNTKRICVCSGKTLWQERKENLTSN